MAAAWHLIIISSSLSLNDHYSLGYFHPYYGMIRFPCTLPIQSYVYCSCLIDLWYEFTLLLLILL
jgi:hypothetical protein